MIDKLAEYRLKTKEYLGTHGAKRDMARKGLIHARESMYNELIHNIQSKISHLQNELVSTYKTREHVEMKNELVKLEHKYRKLQSRLDHDEWVSFMRSIWTFKEMESNVKTGQHPAQFSAEIPRRLIKLYSFVDDIILDPFVGTGTTLVEARKLKRRSIGIDVNQNFLDLAQRRLSQTPITGIQEDYEANLYLGDARKLPFIPNSSINLIIAHPPYWNSIKISENTKDLSNINNEQYNLFLSEMKKAFVEMQRILQPDRVLAILTGDVLRKVDGETKLFPIHSDYIQILTKELSFLLWDIFIVETKIKKSGGKPMMGSYPFPHKLFSEFAHNYCLIFRKKIRTKN